MWPHFRNGREPMNDFEHKVEDASARINRSVANIAEALEKETATLVLYLNDEVIPAVRNHSSKALRSASVKLAEFAEFLEKQSKKQ
jgi:hypothetical protein